MRIQRFVNELLRHLRRDGRGCLLASLPRLPKELEYCFFDRHLLLLDVDADLIVDYIPDALPATAR